MKDDPAKHSREHEVRTCVDNADPDCTVGQRKSTREESPHYRVEEQVHSEETLRERYQSLCLQSSRQLSNTYASHKRFNDHALFLHAEEERPLFELCRGGHLSEDSI